ncbi:MAG: response regulator transcription factor [Acidobacteriota bacterium]
MSDLLRILIADDHAVVRQGLMEMLRLEDDFEILAAATDGRQAVAQYRAMAPDVVLMDLDMPEMDGVTATERIREHDGDARIIILTGLEADGRVLDALAAGASGYVLKTGKRDQLVSMVRKVHAGEISMSPEITAQMLKRLQAKATQTDPLGVLTPREQDVFRRMALGASDREIADEFGIAYATARTHVARILGKLGFQSRLEAAMWAVRKRIVRLEDPPK